MSRYVNIPATSTGSGLTGGWAEERWSVAIDRVSTLNRYASSDLDDGNFIASALCAEDATRSFGVYSFPSGVGTGTLTLGKSATQILVAAPKTESWYASSRVMITDTFTNAGGVISLPLGLAQGADAVYIVGRGSISTTEFQLEFYNPGLTRVALGSSATLGAATCPLDAFFTVSMWFTSATGTLTVEFSDTEVYSSSSLAGMSQVAAQVVSIANDQTKPMYCDSLFCAGVRTNQ